MSEEEAIKICKNIIRSINGDTCYIGYSKEQDKEAIETILNLIEKQQKEIESLESQLDFIGEQNKYIERQTIYLNKLEKELQGKRIEIDKMQKNYEAVIDKMEYEMGYEYINKDKIRDEIKRLEIFKKTVFAPNEISAQVYKEQIDLFNMQINVLKDLLEEK